MDANEKEYPTELVSIDFFGGKNVEAGDKETVEVVSVDDDHVQIKCVSGRKGRRPDAGKEVAGKYQSKMNEGMSEGGY